MTRKLNVCGVCLGFGFSQDNQVILPIQHKEDCTMNKETKRCVRHAIKNIKCSSCEAYGGKDGKLMKCSGCQKAFYCSTECQKSHWKKHKLQCRSNNARSMAIIE